MVTDRTSDPPEPDLASGRPSSGSTTTAVDNARVLFSARRLAANLTLALTHQVTIDQATGVLIASESLSPDRALAQLRADSAANDVPVVVVARAVIDAAAARSVQQRTGSWVG